MQKKTLTSRVFVNGIVYFFDNSKAFSFNRTTRLIFSESVENRLPSTPGASWWPLQFFFPFQNLTASETEVPVAYWI